MRKILIWILISLGVLTLVFIFFGVPILVQYFGILAGTKGNGDWLSFWVSYLGVIPSGLIAALVAGYQIKSSNKQNDEARKQDLIIMRNTKIVAYLYDIKMSVSKSKLILDKSETNLSDKFMFDYMINDEYSLFGEMNFKVLKDQNNHLYFLTGIVFDWSTDKKILKG